MARTKHSARATAYRIANNSITHMEASTSAPYTPTFNAPQNPQWRGSNVAPSPFASPQDASPQRSRGPDTQNQSPHTVSGPSVWPRHLLHDRNLQRAFIELNQLTLNEPTPPSPMAVDGSSYNLPQPPANANSTLFSVSSHNFQQTQQPLQPSVRAL